MFKIEMETGNAAFGHTVEDAGAEVGRILIRLGRALVERDIPDGGGSQADPIKMALRDLSGNTVGIATFHL
jgi:hypothetical protein